MAGLFMCVLAAGLLWIELQILARLFVPFTIDRQKILDWRQKELPRPLIASAPSRKG
jgi:hypothetical protein